jgi:hypothetical protein
MNNHERRLRMRTLLPVLLIAACIVLLVGCLQVHTVVKVKPDGSGTIEERAVMKGQMAMMMMAMAQMQDEQGDAKQKSRFYSEEEMNKRAAEMGEGVRFVSVKEIKVDDGQGYEAVFAFKDISTLKLSESPAVNPLGTRTKEEGEGEQRGKERKEKKYVTFAFAKGNPATLTVYMPPREKKEQSKKEEKKDDQDMKAGIAMARAMFKDFKFSSVIQVQGSIVETDATFREGSTVTLIDVDFDKLMSDENLVNKAMENEDISEEEARELMKRYPGLKIELNKATRIRFR